MTARRVTTAVMGSDLKFFQAEGARLKPMMATMDPLTTGGMTMSIHLAPAKWTITPTRARVRPVQRMPKEAICKPAMPLLAAVTAPMGAIKAKELPR